MSDTIAGRYTLIDPIARGGSGTVWRAWDQRRRMLCAAKVLRQRDSADLLRFVREQSVKLEHPHVLAPYGWAAEDEHVVIAMDLCDGGTLETVLQDHGALSDPVIEEIMLQLLRALQFVHAEGWIHRDVKPANLMMNATATGKPVSRLADFGIATQMEDARLTRIGTVVGTPGYIAPELLEGADPSPAQDLFAAGVVAMRMVHPNQGRGQSPTPDMALHAFGPDSLLGAEIAALLDSDPGVRKDGALALQERLAGESDQRVFTPSRTRDGEELDVFQTLDPLPAEWQEIVEGVRSPPQQPTTGAVTAARSGDAGGTTASTATSSAAFSRSSAAFSRSSAAISTEDVPSGGWIRTNYGLISTPSPGGEPVVGPASGPAGAALHGMPSGLTVEGTVAPSTAPPTEGLTTGSVVQGPLPQQQPSRATLIGGAPVAGWAGSGRRDVSHLIVDETTQRARTTASEATRTRDPITTAAPRSGSSSSTGGRSRRSPLSRFGIHGTTGWMVISVVALVVAIGLLFGVLALNNDGSTDPVPQPTTTGDPQPTGNSGNSGNSNGSDPTIGSGFSGNQPGRLGE